MSHAIYVKLNGEKLLTKKLAELPPLVQKRVAMSALRSGMIVYRKAIVSLIPGNLKDVRKSIGSRVEQSKKTKWRLVAKVGGAVGIGRPKQLAHEAQVKASHGKGKKPGVGISARNVHWWLAGATGAKAKRVPPGVPRTHRSGKQVGVMPKAAGSPVRTGFNNGRAAANRKIKQMLIKGIRRESKKLLAGGKK